MPDAADAGASEDAGAAAAPQLQPDLRAQATAAGAPAELPDAALSNWVLFANGVPTLKLFPKGLFLVPGATQASTYHGYFSPQFSEGKFKLVRRMHNCGKVSSFMEINGKGKAVFPFAANA